jgi:hypothetical protein
MPQLRARQFPPHAAGGRTIFPYYREGHGCGKEKKDQGARSHLHNHRMLRRRPAMQFRERQVWAIRALKCPKQPGTLEFSFIAVPGAPKPSFYHPIQNDDAR